MKNISKILIANRGEIACRIIRSAKKLGVKTVAVYSRIDRNAINVSMSDEAYCIGESSSLESYLKQDRIVDVAKETGCQAVHPGYGFLSENAEFAQLCENSNLIFIGPSSSAIRNMGIKSTSKKIMSEASVPVIPGYHGDSQADDVLISEAKLIGFPLMIKAIRGGGGKGMKISWTPDDFLSQLESARRESLGAFGDEAVLLERFITSPRHVEVQVFGDRHENYVHLFERDCSIQRRHQKIIEEAPAPHLDMKTREDLGLTAVRAAKAVKYSGAGTVEFIYDQNNGVFYFMEMNTRLQVEHAVTEMITGTDLVEWQIRVADGERLPLNQDSIKLNGHAVEARIYAENPYDDFLPTTGNVTYLSVPETSADVRVETSIQEGDDISIHYDPMIAKLIVWGRNREEAFAKLSSSLARYNIAGVETNIGFLSDLSKHRDLLDGKVNTDFITDHGKELLHVKTPTSDILVQACLTVVLWEAYKTLHFNSDTDEPHNPWILERGFRVNHLFMRQLTLVCNDHEYKVDITYKNPKCFIIGINDEQKIDVEADISVTDKKYPDLLIVHYDTETEKCKFFFESDNRFCLFTKENSYTFEMSGLDFDEKEDKLSSEDSGVAISPMPGLVNKVLVKSGDQVKAGDHLIVIMAMKMEYIVKSPKDGIVKQILFDVGAHVAKHACLVEIADS